MTYEDALELALRAHRGQKDKVGEPYIRHPVRVAERVEGDDARVVALLHDVLEDTGWTAADLREAGVDDATLDAIELLTRTPGQDYAAYVAAAAGHPLARAVKLADVADNLERLDAWAAVDPDGHDERKRKYEDARERLLAG